MKTDGPKQVRYPSVIATKLAIYAAQGRLVEKEQARKKSEARKRRAAKFAADLMHLVFDCVTRGMPALPLAVLRAMEQAMPKPKPPLPPPDNSDPSRDDEQSMKGSQPSSDSRESDMKLEGAKEDLGLPESQSAKEGPRTLLTDIPSYKKVLPQQIELFLAEHDSLKPTKELLHMAKAPKSRFREQRQDEAFGVMNREPLLTMRVEAELKKKEGGARILATIEQVIDADPPIFVKAMGELLVLVRRLYLDFPAPLQQALEEVVVKEGMSPDVQLELFPKGFK